MKPAIPLSASLLVGVCAGLAAHWSELAPGKNASALPASADSPSVSETPIAREEREQATVMSASETEAFHTLSSQQQLETLQRLSQRIFKRGGSCRDELLLARVVAELSFDQALAAMDGLSKPEDGKNDASSITRASLAERLAAADPKRALALGTKNEDPKVAEAAIAAMAQKNGADALRALAELPDKFRGAVASSMRGGVADGVGKASGTIAEMTAVLKENPQLFDPKSNSEGAVRRMLGQVATQAAIADPTAAMADVRKLAAALAQVKPGEDPKPAESAIVARIAPQMTRVLRFESPAAARAVFNSLADGEKNDMMVTLEAAARYRESGVDTALQFAEKQGRDQHAKDAAGGVWFSLAQENRASALQWIDSLPSGPFRDGALNSVAQEALYRTRSWGDPQEAVKAGMELRSAAAKLDYFTSLASQRRSDGSSQSEFIAALPLPEAEKTELRRRLAPIKAK